MNSWECGGKKKKINRTWSVHQFSLWGKLKLLGSYYPGNIQLSVRGDSCSRLNHQNQLRKCNSLTLFEVPPTTWCKDLALSPCRHWEGQEKCSMLRKWVVFPLSHKPQESLQCHVLVKYWEHKRVESPCSTKWGQREKIIYSILQFIVTKKKSRRFHEGDVASVGKKE